MTPVMAATWIAVVLAAASAPGCGGDAQPAPTGIDLSAIDLTADPCVDFYQYACGTWITRHPVSASASYVRRFDDPFYALVTPLRGIMEHDATGTPAADDPQGNLVGHYYQSCLDAPAGDARHALDAQLTAIAAIQSLTDLAQQAAAQRQIGSGTLFSSRIITNVWEPARRIVFIDQGGIELAHFHYVDPSEAATMAAYRTHIMTLAGFFPAVAIDADQVIDIERRLAQGGLDPDQRGDPRTLHHPMTIDALTALAPNFPWAPYFQAMGQGDLESVDVAMPAYLAALDQLLASTPLVALKMYMAWQLIQDKAPRMDEAVLAADFAFWGPVVNGVSERQARWWTCYKDTQSRFGMALAQPYLARTYNDQITGDVRGLVSDLRSVLAQRISHAGWLDAPTQAEAQTKLLAITDKVGRPAAWPSFDGLALPGSYLANDLAIDDWINQRDLALLAQPVDHALWTTSPTTVNAFYSPIDNAITIPAAILALPFFAEGYSRASNYGSIGVVIGHELTHGFDNSGRLFDGGGGLRDWWTSDTEAAFSTRAQCLVDEYSTYQALPGLPVDGRLTLPENIADLGGVNLAYAALAARGFQEGDRGGLNERQQFFVAFAQTFCESAQPQYIETLVATDPHSPSRVRVNAVLANVPEAAEAFSCAPGTPLAPVASCSVW